MNPEPAIWNGPPIRGESGRYIEGDCWTFAASVSASSGTPKPLHGRPARWFVYLRVVAAIFWTSLNAIGYAMKAVGKRRAG